MKKAAVMLIATLVFACVGSAEIKFLSGTLKDAVDKATAEKKPVMIDFVTDWCRWCDTLDARTYSDAAVASFVNGKLVPIKIDAEKGEGIDIAKKYGVKAYPTILLIKTNGEEIDRLLGYMPPEPFLKTLSDYLSGVNTLSSLRAEVAAKPNDPELHYKIAKRYAERNEAKEAAPHYQRVIALDTADVLKHGEESRFMLAMASLRGEKNIAPLADFIRQYPSSPMTRSALSTILNFSVKEKNAPQAKMYADQYFARWPDDLQMMNNYAWSCAGQKVNLEDAGNWAAKAVSMASSNGEKAMYLDTHAAVEFARGNVDHAISLEQQALGLLKDASPKDRKEYEQALQKFQAAKK